MIIHISEILSEPNRWIWTGDGYRELEKFGNLHTKFIDSELLEAHTDQYNATSFPIGTINHLAKWVNEKTGIDEGLLRLVGGGSLVYAGYRFFK